MYSRSPVVTVLLCNCNMSLPSLKNPTKGNKTLIPPACTAAAYQDNITYVGRIFLN